MIAHRSSALVGLLLGLFVAFGASAARAAGSASASPREPLEAHSPRMGLEALARTAVDYTPTPEPVAGAPLPAEESVAAALEDAFARAQADPAAVVPLILDVSARIAESSAEAGHALAERLAPFSRRAFLGPERLPGMERLGLKLHTVASGELPSRIAKRYAISAGLLPLLNEGYDARRLRVGQELKVLDLKSARLELVVDTSGYRLAAWMLRGDALALVLYVPVGLGAPATPTPTGRTKIVDRVLDPSWTHPVTKVTYPPDHPENILGGYWIRLDPDGIGKSGIGFHGYTGAHEREWLGRAGSNGCIRMRQADVDPLFHLALNGTPVLLR